ncbi:MAG: HNH/ENDO VII family nuclease [Oscillospiraceae bacterium]|nr:HNH/ENDO VII family nuclease [Oscillospiraceae bacterium]
MPKTFNGKLSLIRQVDLNRIDEAGRANAQRILEGLSPLDDMGIAYELHHIGQKTDSPLAILTKAEHMSPGNNTIFHNTSIETGVHAEISTAAWQKEVKEFWNAYLNLSQEGF